MEIWKDIEGYEGFYQISNLGRVKSSWFGREKILKNCKDRYGYLFVRLYKDGKGKSYLIHRLVATAFIPNPDNQPEVNHINEIKTDNRVENLEYCNSKYNNNFGTRNKRIAKRKTKRILQFSKTGELVRKWDSIIQVEKELGFENGNISKCCKGKLKLAYGYKWCYHYKSLWLKKHIPLIKQKKVA